jgi:hypothetical protein
MPRCLSCGTQQSSAEVRRLPGNRYRCKDPARCEQRREKVAKQLDLFEAAR